MAEPPVAHPAADQATEPPVEPSGDGGPATGDDSDPIPSSGSGVGPARMTAIVVGVVVAALVVLFAFGRDDQTTQGSALLGARAEPVVGDVLGGGRFDIDDHRGSWVLVNFFATWCPPCVAEHPDLVELEAWGAGRGDLQLVSVVFNDPPEDVARFFEERGGSWPVIDNPTVAVDYRVSQIPESFLISPAGQVVLHIEGQLTASAVKQLLDGEA